MTNQPSLFPEYEESPSLATKIFSDMCCKNCSCKPQYESNPIVEKDSMGRELFWLDLGRP